MPFSTEFFPLIIFQLRILASSAFITWCPARPSGWPFFPSTSAHSSETAGPSNIIQFMEEKAAEILCVDIQTQLRE